MTPFRMIPRLAFLFSAAVAALAMAPSAVKSAAAASPAVPGALPGATLVLAAAAAASSEPAGKPNETATEAVIKSLLAAGETTRAIEASRQRVAANPKDADAHVLLANALLKKATDDAMRRPPRPNGLPAPIRPEEADAIARELDATLAIVPERKDVYMGLIVLAGTAARNDELVRQVARTGKAFPGDPTTMANLMDFASDAYDHGDLDLAGRIVEAVYDAYPRQPDAILAWAAFLLNRGELGRSKEVLQAGVKFLPGNATIHQSLGDAICYELDFEAAAKSYARAATIDPSNDVVRLSWAAALHVFDPAAARIVAEQVWSESLKNSPAPTVETDQDAAAKAKHRVTMAGNMLLRAIMRPPFTATDAYALGRSFWQAGFPAPAMSETEVCLRKDGAFAEALVLRAEIQNRLGLASQALDAVRRAEEILDTNQGRTFAVTRDEVLVLRAGIEAKLGKNEDALTTYRRTSDPGRYTYPMALAAERLGRIEEARTLLEKTIASGTNPTEIDAARARLAIDLYRKKP